MTQSKDWKLRPRDKVRKNPEVGPSPTRELGNHTPRGPPPTKCGSSEAQPKHMRDPISQRARCDPAGFGSHPPYPALLAFTPRDAWRQGTRRGTRWKRRHRTLSHNSSMRVRARAQPAFWGPRPSGIAPPPLFPESRPAPPSLRQLPQPGP